MSNHSNTCQPKPSDYHPFECYQTEFVKDFYAFHLVTFAYTNFFKVIRIQIFSKLKEFVYSADFRDIEKRNIFFNNNKDFVLTSLLDYILISITFENYFKAKLLLNGFVIHEIKKEESFELYKKQRKIPISSEELKFENKSCCKEIKMTTLNYGFLLKNKEYTKYYNLDIKALTYLINLNEKRNSLHLYYNKKFEFGKIEIAKTEQLKKIVELDFAVLNNSLADKTGAVGNCRLRIKQ